MLRGWFLWKISCSQIESRQRTWLWWAVLSTNNKMRFLRSMMRRQGRFLACDNLLLLQAQTWTPRISNKRTFKNLESRDKRKGQRVPAGRCGTRLWSCELEFVSTTRASRACDYKSKKRIIIMKKKKHISTISSSSTMHRALDYQSKKRMIRKNKQQQQKRSRIRIQLPFHQHHHHPYQWSIAHRIINQRRE